MKKILYIRLTDHKPQSKRSILKRAKEKLVNTREEKNYTITGIYDERLINIGSMMEYYLPDKKNSDAVKKYHSDVEEFFHSAKFDALAFEDISSCLGYEKDHYDGASYILKSDILSLKEEKKISSEDFVGVMLSEETDYQLIKIISREFRYIMLYCPKEKYAKEVSDYLMNYFSTAAVVTSLQTNLFSCKALISLSRKSTEYDNGQNLLIHPYRKFSPADRSNFHAYTDQFSPLLLSAAFCEAMNGNVK